MLLSSVNNSTILSFESKFAAFYSCKAPVKPKVFNMICQHVSQQGKIVRVNEGLTLETSVSESFTVANLPYRPCG